MMLVIVVMVMAMAVLMVDGTGHEFGRYLVGQVGRDFELEKNLDYTNVL